MGWWPTVTLKIACWFGYYNFLSFSNMLVSVEWQKKQENIQEAYCWQLFYVLTGLPFRVVCQFESHKRINKTLKPCGGGSDWRYCIITTLEPLVREYANLDGFHSLRNGKRERESNQLCQFNIPIISSGILIIELTANVIFPRVVQLTYKFSQINS